MKLSAVLQSLALASLVSATPVAHLHHNHKRGVVHVTETVMVTVAAGGADLATTVLDVDAAAATTEAAAAAATTEAPVLDVANKVAVNTAAADTTSETSAAETSSGASSGSATSGSAGSIGITYSPYNNDGTCKDLSSVQSDLAKLDDYAIIRLYGVDCNQVANVLQAKKSGQKLFLGIFYVDDIAGGVSSIADAISSYGSWDDVHTVSVGNELVNNGAATPSQIKSYIDTARSALTSSGYSGPVVSVDTHVAILANTELCEYSDYIAFNAHAYWDGTIESSGAGSWLLLQMQRVSSACGKNVMCVESGWPHKGDNNGVAVASESDQAAAVASLESVVGNDVIIFTAFDDLWKNPGSHNCEQYWGIL